MIATDSYGPQPKINIKISKKCLVETHLTHTFYCHHQRMLRPFETRKKTFQLEIIFLSKSFTKKIEKKI